MGSGEGASPFPFFCIFYRRNMQIHASPSDFSACLEMRSSANSSNVLASQVPTAYSYQHSDYMHTLKTAIAYLKLLNNYCQAEKNKW
jgi:hypothetical protein